MDVVKLLTEQLNSRDTLSTIGKSVGVQPAKVKKVTELGMPALIDALQQNISTESGAKSLSKALDEHKDDNVGDLGGFLSNVDTEDGAKILQHIFGGKNKKVQSNIAKQAGLKTDQVAGILSQLAPVLLGALGNEKKDKGLGTSGISDLLDILSGNISGDGLMKIATNILDADKDGSIADDVGGILGKLFKGVSSTKKVPEPRRPLAPRLPGPRRPQEPRRQRGQKRPPAPRRLSKARRTSEYSPEGLLFLVLSLFSQGSILPGLSLCQGIGPQFHQLVAVN